MALARQQVRFPFSGGLGDKAARPHLPVAKLATATNCYQEKAGEIRMRKTATALGRDIISGGSLSAATDLHIHNDEILQRNYKAIYGYDANTAKWSSLGTAWRAKSSLVTTAHDRRPNTSDAAMDVAVGGGYIAYIYMTPNPGPAGAMYCDIIDSTTGLPVLARAALYSGADGQIPKVVATASEFVFFWVEEGASSSILRARRIAFATPTTMGSATTVASDLPGTGEDDTAYDVWRVPASLTNIWVVYGRESGGTYYWSNAIWNGATMSVTVGPTHTAFAGVAPDLVLGILDNDTSDGFGYVGVGTTIAGSVCRVSQVTLSTTVIATTGGNVNAGTIPRNISGFWDGTNYTIYVELMDSGVLKINKTLSTGFVGTSTDLFKMRCGLATNTFLFGSDTTRCLLLVNYPYGPGGTRSSNSCYLLVDASGNTISRVLYQNGGGLRAGSGGSLQGMTTTRSARSHMVALSSNKYMTACQRLADVDPSGTYLYGMTGVAFELGAALGAWGAAQGVSIEPAGMARTFDGKTGPEVNFLESPQVPSLAETAGGNLTLLETYTYALCYSYRDQRENLIRSEPSTAATVTLTGANRSVDLTISTLQFTDRKLGGPWGTIPDVTIEVYRTYVVDGQISEDLKLVGTVANDTNANTVTFSDTLSDVTAAAQEPLYTDGGEIANQHPPGLSCVVYHQGRYFAISSENPKTVVFSKLVLPGEGVSFSSELSFDVDTDGVMLASMDDKLVILCANEIYVQTGDGPDNTGGGAFGLPQKLPTFVGCSDPRTVTTTPSGVVFKGAKGIWIITRGLSVEYIGADVEDSNSLTVTGVYVQPAVNQIRFTTSAGTTLVYDWLFGQWYRFTSQAAVASGIWRSQWVYLASDAKVYVEDSVITANTGYSMTFKTAPIQIDGIKGFQRLYCATLFGEYRAAHTVQTDIYFDNSQNVSETHRFDTANIYATQGEPEDVDIAPASQKSDAVQFEFTVTPSAGSAEPFRAWGLAFECGLKGRLSTQPIGRTAYNRG